MLLVLGRRGSLAPLREVPGMPAQDAFLQLVPQRADAGVLVLQAGHGQLGGASKGYHARDVLGAAAPAPLLSAADHVRLVLDAPFHVEQPDALGRMQLVRRKRQEVHVEFPHINLQLARRLHGVGVEQHAMPVANRGNLAHREQDARLVVRPHDRDDGGIRANGLLQLLQVQRAVRLHGQEGHGATALLEQLAELDVRRVLDRSGQDVGLAGLRDQGALDRRVVALGAATGEDDLARLGVDQGRNPRPGFVQVRAELASEGVGARRVAPILAQERKHGLDHLGGDLRRGVVVEVINRRAAHPPKVTVSGLGSQALSRVTGDLRPGTRDSSPRHPLSASGAAG